jgi:hypothetical protein
MSARRHAHAGKVHGDSTTVPSVRSEPKLEGFDRSRIENDGNATELDQNHRSR